MEGTTMTKKVIDFNRLPKQEYLKPAMEICQADTLMQILAGSVTTVNTTGLGDEAALKKDEETGNPWEFAW